MLTASNACMGLGSQDILTIPGNFTTPGFSDDGTGKYNNNMDCQWVLQSPSGTVRVITSDSYPLVFPGYSI